MVQPQVLLCLCDGTAAITASLQRTFGAAAVPLNASITLCMQILPHLILVQGNGVSEGDAEEEMAYTDETCAEPAAANGHGRGGDFTERAQYIPLRLQVMNYNSLFVL